MDQLDNLPVNLKQLRIDSFHETLIRAYCLRHLLIDVLSEDIENSKGTKDMVTRAKNSNLEVEIIPLFTE